MRNARCVGPALDAGKQAFDAGTVTADRVTRCRGGIHVSRPIRFEYRDEILCAGQDEDIGFFDIVVARQALVRLARYGRQRKIPAQAEWAVACARIIG